MKVIKNKKYSEYKNYNKKILKNLNDHFQIDNWNLIKKVYFQII